jgi:phosphopantothenoylcysteine decarboxylase/phosphopantothenate--cysteine ligase
MKKKILLGLSGSVACSKAELFVNQNSKKYEFKLLSTYSGLNYLSDQFIKSNTIYSDWSELTGSPHIELARWADEIIIYPASANLISKISFGIADDLLTSTLLMFSKPIYICPAMHEEMYMNSQIQSNILNLSKNHYIVGPRHGNLDIGDKGLGRLIEPDELLRILNKLNGKIIVTSGPTYEEIDDVKVITNKSSGKQGRALAVELSARGYEIVYIHAASIDPIPGLNNVSFHSSNDLKNKILENINSTEAIFMTAAVSDFTVNKSSGKISRSNGNISIEFEPNEDIIATIKSSHPEIKCIAFSAQVNDELSFNKINSKKVDYLVINNILKNKFGSDTNKVSIIDQQHLIFESEELDKNEISRDILNTLEY